METLKRKFHEDMVEQHHIRVQRGYRAVLIEKSISEFGGYETAKRFIPKTVNPTKGFLNLVERGLLAYSVESLVVKPEYVSLFTVQERKICKTLLETHGYNISLQQSTTISPPNFKPQTNTFTYTTEQQALFNFIQSGNGNGIINAVAGSGKTTTIMECSKYIPEHSKALFCAFNKSIAQEIGLKLRKISTSSIIAKTIHSLGLQILNQHFGSLNIVENKYKQLINSQKIQDEFSSYYKKLSEREINKKNHWFKVNEILLDMVNKYRLIVVKPHDDLDYDDLEEMINHYDVLRKPIVLQNELQEYLEMLFILLKYGNEQAREIKIMDFTDMLYLPCIWELSSPHTYDFMFIDECQDLSKAQLLIAMKFINTESRVVAVGDPYQAINGFAGADTESFNRVNEIFEATYFPLTVCFRCPEEVIQMAKVIRSDISGTNKVGKVFRLEYSAIFGKAKVGDLIISRKKEPLIPLMFAFIDKGNKVFFRLEDAKDILTRLRGLFKPNEIEIVFYNSSQDLDDFFDDVVKRNTWKITKQVERMNLSDESKLAEINLQIKQLQVNIDFIIKLYHSWKTATIKELLERLYDDITSEIDSIKISTIHCAKGLENDKVFIIGYDELPLSWLGILPWQEEQEKNLKYVALTRAKRELYLVKSETNTITKGKAEIFNTTPNTKVIAMKTSAIINFDKNSVDIGTKVKHKKFGDGIVVRFKDDKKTIIVSFDDSESMFQFPSAFENGYLATC